MALSVILLAPSLAFSAPRTAVTPSETTPEGVGLQAASVLASVVYFPFKAVLALTGGIVGGLSYALTGGSQEVAQSIWEPSMYGTYIITPEHLSGRRPVQFFGTSPGHERYPGAPR